MAFKNARARKRFFAQIKPPKPTKSEITVRAGILPFPKAEIEWKNSWELKNKKIRRISKA